MSPNDDPVSTSALDADEDDVSDLLADPYTRTLLRCLRDADGEASLHTLAEHVASSVTSQDVEDIDADTCRQVETFLHHGQLPELAKYGIVDYDAEDGRITLRTPEILED